MTLSTSTPESILEVLPSARLQGTSALVVSDLHLSDKFRGQHRDYLKNCRNVMNIITKQAQDNNISCLILLGDVFGVKERRFTSRKFFLEVYQWLSTLNDLTSGNLYSVKGNHDIDRNDPSEFDVFVELSLIKRVSHLDFSNPDQDAGVRFHFVDYGEEHRVLPLSKAYHNVALTHNDFGLPGQPSAWHNPKALVLESLSNFQGISLVVGGHIHTPSPAPSYVTFPDGSETILYYPGCPTRVSQRFEDCSSVLFTFEDNSVQYGVIPYGLPPVSEEFFPEEDDDDALVTSLDDSALETLKSIVGSLKGKSLVEGDLIAQINNRKDVTDSVKKLSVSFLQDALNTSK